MERMCVKNNAMLRNLGVNILYAMSLGVNIFCMVYFDH